jgi:hypothetical protein
VLSDENLQRYAKGLYPLGILLLLVPLADITLRVFPPQFGQLQWRFATVGLLLGNTGTVLLGLAITGLVAAVSGHRTLLRVLGFVYLLLGIVLLAVLALFLLDAVQIRQMAAANFKRQILVSAMGAAFGGLLGTIALFSMARGALAASKPTRLPERRVKAAPSPLVVAGSGASDAL